MEYEFECRWKTLRYLPYSFKVNVAVLELIPYGELASSRVPWTMMRYIPSGAPSAIGSSSWRMPLSEDWFSHWAIRFPRGSWGGSSQKSCHFQLSCFFYVLLLSGSSSVRSTCFKESLLWAGIHWQPTYLTGNHRQGAVITFIVLFIDTVVPSCWLAVLERPLVDHKPAIMSWNTAHEKVVLNKYEQSIIH